MVGQGLKQREEVMGRRVCGKRPVCGAQGARDFGNQAQGKVASPGREVGGKAGWGTVVCPAVYTSCASGSFVLGTLFSPGEGHRLKLYQLGTWASTYSAGMEGDTAWGR